MEVEKSRTEGFNIFLVYKSSSKDYKRGFTCFDGGGERNLGK